MKLNNVYLKIQRDGAPKLWCAIDLISKCAWTWEVYSSANTHMSNMPNPTKEGAQVGNNVMRDLMVGLVTKAMWYLWILLFLACFENSHFSHTISGCPKTTLYNKIGLNNHKKHLGGTCIQPNKMIVVVWTRKEHVPIIFHTFFLISQPLTLTLSRTSP